MLKVYLGEESLNEGFKACRKCIWGGVCWSTICILMKDSRHAESVLGANNAQTITA